MNSGKPGRWITLPERCSATQRNLNVWELSLTEKSCRQKQGHQVFSRPWGVGRKRVFCVRWVSAGRTAVLKRISVLSQSLLAKELLFKTEVMLWRSWWRLVSILRIQSRASSLPHAGTFTAGLMLCGPSHRIIFFAICNCKFATVMGHNVNICVFP